VFPEFPLFDVQADLMDSNAAFFAGDYAAMVRYAETAWQKIPSYQTASALSGAYASLYAATGDTEVRQKAVEMMTRSRTLASSQEDREDLEAWEPRFEHRLRTRRILTSKQYDALFRAAGQTREGPK
jgi:hypothetical protein